MKCKKIPYGHIITLGELAVRVAETQTKDKGSINGVAGAIKTNPIAIIIPRHRYLKKRQGEKNNENISVLSSKLRIIESQLN
ncbi:MGMT family protein [Aerococcus viridans]